MQRLFVAVVPLSITYVNMLFANLGRSPRCAVPCEFPKIMSCVLGVRRPYGAVLGPAARYLPVDPLGARL